jgi:hypothetical protein
VPRLPLNRRASSWAASAGVWGPEEIAGLDTLLEPLRARGIVIVGQAAEIGVQSLERVVAEKP